jgi:predicted O-methyltransferase YrrM
MTQRDTKHIFTTDWFTHNAPSWDTHLSPLRDRVIDYLEIGSWEGRSALFLCELLPKARLTCVDLWQYHPHLQAPVKENEAAEKLFDTNTAPYAERIRKIKGRSAWALDILRSEDATFDVIYIDGDHTRWGVLIDTVLAWPLLRIGGIMIFDDYLLDLDQPRGDRPKDAVDLFHRTFVECMTVLHSEWQVFAKKKADWPEKPAQDSLFTGRNIRRLLRGKRPKSKPYRVMRHA